MKSGKFFEEVSPRVLATQYAVRGAVPTKALQIKQDLVKNPSKYPFSEVIFCNIGNPQEFRQKPISFNRQVLACMVNPNQLNFTATSDDAKKRAKWYIDNIISAGSYTHSFGIPLVRESVTKYIEKSDEVPKPSVNDIILTEGASQGVHILVSMLITKTTDGIMIPIPQYPLYSASISLNGGQVVAYYLDEESGWQLQEEQLQRSYQEAVKKGIRVRSLVVINPGNPTGAIFSPETIKKIISFCVNKRILIIADEVYRENIYKEGAQFYSFRKVLNTMEPKYRQTCELASLHSVSKGLMGECGFRGGYLYVHNFGDKVRAQLLKLKSVNLCSNTIGQASVEMMCNPPIENVSEATKNQYLAERKALFESLKKRAKLVTKYLNEMKNIKAQEVEGAMYAFPSITFSPKVIEISKGKPDLFYCMEVLKNTGIVIIPGSGFKQREGTYHFRITILILPDEKLEKTLQNLKRFNDQFHAKYETNAKL